jgi:FtsP/CotA-like multicopper oxidase with cupredoxin domain
MLRRSFLQGVAAGTLVSGSVSIKPSLALTQLDQSHFELVAEIGKGALGPVGTSQTDLWLYNGTTPGPMLTVTKGDELIVNFFNKLDQPTTIHWHGIRNLNEMDGVPDLTQVPVDPGEEFTYRFPVRDAGTFWYHAHSKAWEQVTRGLYGPLIVREPDANPGVEDITLVADDWRLTEDYQFHEESLGSMMDWSHQGRLGNWLTINGQSNPAIPIRAKNLARIRLINTANARSMTFEFDGKHFEVIALDGEPCSPFVASEIMVAPAQRVDILINTDSSNFSLSEISTGTPVILATFKAHTSALNIPDRPDLQAKTFRSDLEMIDIDIHMQGGAMGNLASAFFEGEERPLQDLAMEHSKLWAFNGSIGG